MKNKTIVLIEDEHKIAEILKKYLEHEGFEVITLEEGKNALSVIDEVNPVLCILDLMLPDSDGLSICESIRQHSDVPIIILTQKDHEDDRLAGLNIGADDYICKPVGPREVVARVHTILRRTSSKEISQAKELKYNDITLLHDEFECYVLDKKIELTPLEFNILSIFVSHPKKVFSREKIMDSCYGNKRIVSDRTIDTHIKNLRRKIMEATGEQQILSVYGKGYKLI